MAAGVPALAAGNEVKSMKGHLAVEQLKSMTRENLQALAKDLGVSAGGKTEEIIERIAAVEIDVSESELTEEEKAAFVAEAARLEEAASKQKIKEGAEPVTVKAVTRFLDKQLNQIKDAGEAYNVSEERAAELVAAGVVEIVG